MRQFVTTESYRSKWLLGQGPMINVVAIRETGQNPGAPDPAKALEASKYESMTAAALRMPVFIQKISVANGEPNSVRAELLAEVAKALKEAARVPAIIHDFTGRLNAWGQSDELGLGDMVYWPEGSMSPQRAIIDLVVHPEDSSFRLGLAYEALTSSRADDVFEKANSGGDLSSLRFTRTPLIPITDVHLINATEFDSDFVAPALAKATSCIKHSLPDVSIASTNISSQDTIDLWSVSLVQAVRNTSSDNIIVVVPSRLLASAQRACLNPKSGLTDKRITFATCDTYANGPKQINESYFEFTIGKALGGLCEAWIGE